MKEIARGAEAVVFDSGNEIVKERFAKSYRHPELDSELRKQRTRREANLLKKLPIAHPKLIQSDEKEKIVMEKIEGDKLREALDEKPELARAVGEMLAKMHDAGVMHGDLTTSNIILKNDGGLVFIDFGLSFQSHKAEDRAVDIHLFKQALESKHFRVYDRALKEFLKGYSGASGHDETIKRLRQVELRGRYRKG